MNSWWTPRAGVASRLRILLLQYLTEQNAGNTSACASPSRIEQLAPVAHFDNRFLSAHALITWSSYNLEDAFTMGPYFQLAVFSSILFISSVSLPGSANAQTASFDEEPDNTRVEKKTISGRAIGEFEVTPCPSGSPAGAFCLSVVYRPATFEGIGTVTGQFTVVFDQQQTFADRACNPIHKEGTITVEGKGTLNISGEGYTCNGFNLFVGYTYKINGGTGKFAKASGSGLWMIPPPTSPGMGPEYLRGTLLLRRGSHNDD